MYGADDARRVPAERGPAVSAGRTGQIFGVKLDDGKATGGTFLAPNIYVMTTSVFRLQLLLETATKVTRTRTGDPGGISKIDGASGEVSLFANVVLERLDNSASRAGQYHVRSGRTEVFPVRSASRDDPWL